MSRNRNNVNASLIHELRMIIQTLAVSRSFHGVAKRKSRSSALKCLVCFKVDGNKEPNDAVFVSNGRSVCEVHA